MKVKRREVRNFGEGIEIQILIEMLIDVLGDTMHSIDVHIAASG